MAVTPFGGWGVRAAIAADPVPQRVSYSASGLNYSVQSPDWPG